MYKVTFAHKDNLSKEYPLYTPGDVDYCLVSGKATLEEGKTGEMELSVPYNNPNRKNVVCLTDDIILRRSNKSGGWDEIFRGRVVTTQQDFYLTGRLSIEGDMAYLYDTLYPPFTFNGAPRTFLQQVINNHNSFVPAHKRFTLGTVTVKSGYSTIKRENTFYTKSLELLTSNFIEEGMGGFFRTRYSNGTRYLDYLSSYATTSSQKLKFGSNIIDLAEEIEYGDLITAVLPLGKMPEAEKVKTTTTVNGKTKTTTKSVEQDDSDRLNISSVNGGDIYLRDTNLINKYGFIAETVTWDDVESASALKTKGENYLKEHGVSIQRFTINALDLAHVYPDDYDHFRIGDKVPLDSPPHSVNQTVELTKMNLNLLAPEQDTFEYDDEKLTKSRGFSSGSSIVSNTLNVNQNVQKTVNKAVTQVTNSVTQVVANNFSDIIADSDVITQIVEGITGVYNPISSGEVEDLIDEKINDYDVTIKDYVETEITTAIEELHSEIQEEMDELEERIVEETHEIVAEEINDLRDDLSEEVDTKLLVAEQAIVENLDATYAQIDFANVGIANIGEFFAKAGIIEDIVTENGTITGELVGVTIRGDLIEGNTIKADKLVILGSDGLYYKLNTNGETVEAQQTQYNSLDGSHILAQSITASKISVSDLVAFHATIAGLQMDNGSIHTYGKNAVNSPVPGLYFDSDGQFNTGDANNYFVSWYDEDAEEWKIRMSVSEVIVGRENLMTAVTGVRETVQDMEDRMDSGEFKGEDGVVLRIDSSRGTVFKNNAVTTVLTVTIYYGAITIENLASLRAAFGNTAHIVWYWQRLDEDRYGIISASDPMLSNNGFTLTLTPSDVDTKVTFRCSLEID